MKYALLALRFSGDDEDRESQAPGYLGSDGSDPGEPREGCWSGDPTATTLEAVGEVGCDGSTDACTEYPSVRLVCSRGWLDGLDANSRNPSEVESSSRYSCISLAFMIGCLGRILHSSGAIELKNSPARHCIFDRISVSPVDNQIRTFRVVFCSKQLLAAPVIVWNDEAWKSKFAVDN